jgi:hypothetical protein
MRTLLLAALLMLPLSARAVDNSKRLVGLGFNTHVKPSVSIKWTPATKMCT